MLQAPVHRFFNTSAGRLFLHLLFWVAAAAFLVFFFGPVTGSYRYTALFVSLLLPIALGTSYLINYFLIPHYLLRQRYTRFVWYFVFTLIISVWAAMLLVVWAFIVLANYQYSNLPPLATNLLHLMVSLYFLVILSSSIKLLRHWYQGQQHIAELRSQQLEAELKLREAELQLLRGQIHPHFLFNTLNNLYGLALEKSEQLPDALLRLSGLLAALLYRSHNSQVPLTQELKLIEDYVKLEELRFEDRLELQWEVEGPVAAYAIAPFLLFPFLENAFKHGFSENTERLQLQVAVRVQEGKLHFSVINSIAPSDGSPSAMAGGIGLANVQKRLALLYPGQHRLQLRPTDSHYQIQLQLKLQQTNNLYAYAKQSSSTMPADR